MFHGHQNIPGLIGDGFQCRPDEVFLAHPTGQSNDESAGVHVPVRSPQTGECRNYVDPIRIGNGGSQGFRFLGRVDDPEFIAQPLHRGTTHEHGTLQRIGDLAIQPPGNGGQKAMLGSDRFRSCVHEQKAAGAIGILCHAHLKAALAEQCRLLVSRGSGNGDLRPAESSRVGDPIKIARGPDNRQHLPGDIQQFQDLFIPGQVMDVKQHGSGRVGIIRCVNLAPGKIVDQPGVHGSEEQFPRPGSLPGSRHMIQDPLQLGGRKVGIQNQSCLLAEPVLQPPGLEFLTQSRSPATLPDDGVMDRLSRGFFPHDRRLPLVGNAHGRNFIRTGSRSLQDFPANPHLSRPYFHGILLHPARLWINLCYFLLGHPANGMIPVKQDHPRTGGSLIQRHHILFLHKPS